MGICQVRMHWRSHHNSVYFITLIVKISYLDENFIRNDKDQSEKHPTSSHFNARSWAMSYIHINIHVSETGTCLT